MTVTIHRHNAAQAAGLRDPIIQLFVTIYADRQHDPFFQPHRFRQQLESHMTRPGWELTTASDNDQLIGFAYGFPLPSDTAWWSGLRGNLPPNFTTETGHRTFALSELNVHPAHRRKGLATHLYNELITHRPEQRATLLAEPDNEAGNAIYRHWGWTKVAQLQPNWENAPLLDVWTRDLR